jgi:hypothetical protein
MVKTVECKDVNNNFSFHMTFRQLSYILITITITRIC